MRRLLGVVLAVAAACGAAPSPPTGAPAPVSPPPDRVTVTAREFRFALPALWRPGWATVTLLDDGSQPHQLQLARLRPGAGAAGVAAAFRRGDPGAAFAALVLVGGADTVEPGLGQRVTVRLDPGDYLALDLAAGPDGVQNVARGMVQPFTVAGPPAGDEPAAAGELVERSFGFALPPVPVGPVVLRVRDASAGDVHEAAIVRPDPGVGTAAVLAFLAHPAGPPPFRFAGGLAGLEPGATGYLDLDLDAGSYVLLCLVTDPATGRFHADEGMVLPFTAGTPA